MEVGDLVRFREPAQRTEGECGVVIGFPQGLPTHVRILWSNNRLVLEYKLMLEVLSEVRRSS